MSAESRARGASREITPEPPAGEAAVLGEQAQLLRLLTESARDVLLRRRKGPPRLVEIDVLNGYPSEDVYRDPELGDRDRHMERSVPPWT